MSKEVANAGFDSELEVLIEVQRMVETGKSKPISGETNTDWVKRTFENVRSKFAARN